MPTREGCGPPLAVFVQLNGLFGTALVSQHGLLALGVWHHALTPHRHEPRVVGVEQFRDMTQAHVVTLATLCINGDTQLVYLAYL